MPELKRAIVVLGAAFMMLFIIRYSGECETFVLLALAIITLALVTEMVG